MKADLVSFVVPTRNSARTIEACLRSIREQRYPEMELVVVDNGSQDGTVEIAKEYATRLLLAGPERSRQRNLGAEASSGRFLVFVDSDMVLPPSLAREVVDGFSAAQGLGALILPERSIGDGFWARCRILEKQMYVGDPDVEAARAFRRAAFMCAGGYDEQLHAGEDWDLSERVAAISGVGRTSSFIVHDEGRLSLAADLAKKMYYGRSVGRYARKHPSGAVRRLMRRAITRGLWRLARNPLHGAGLMILKGLELGAVAVGMLVDVVRKRPAGRSSEERAP